MSEPNDPLSTPPAETTTAQAVPAAPPAADAAAPSEELSRLMAAGEKAAPAKPSPRPGPDLEAEALRAAEEALAEGERALAAARAQLQEENRAAQVEPAVTSRRRRREAALRLLLAVNVCAMVVVALWPLPAGSTGAPTEQPPAQEHPTEPVAAQRYNEPWNRAMAAADRRDFASAVAILESYLQDSPKMPPSQRLNVYMALAHYSARIGSSESIRKAQEYQRRADAIDRSHSLPEDLVAMAEAAAKNGDQEALRRVWARFLLQQREIPSWLFKHVAEAYLQLGDSYRQEAAAAAEVARRKDLEAAAEQLRRDALQAKEQRR